ncbi:MAG: PhoH family protein [Candidatus Woesearchaeota archaeon]|nr:PhoH family protein [Candidatus Woesearchaeota archaeon]
MESSSIDDMITDAEQVYVIDSNAFINDPRIIENLFHGDETIEICVVPDVVIDELGHQGHKEGNPILQRNANETLRYLNKLRKNDTLEPCLYSPIPNKYVYLVDTREYAGDSPSSKYRENEEDDLITSVAIGIKNKTSKVVLVTDDVRMTMRASRRGLSNEQIMTLDEVDKFTNSDLLYKGWVNLEYLKQNEQDMINIYHYLDPDMIKERINRAPFPNEYFFAKGGSLILRYDAKQNRVVRISTQNLFRGISGKNPQQTAAIDAMMNTNIDVVRIIGMPGSGKTYLALAAALKFCTDKTIENRVYSSILAIKPIVGIGKGLGFEPGTREEKMQTWMRSYYDALHSIFETSSNIMGEVKGLEDKHIIEYEVMHEIQGRNLPGRFGIIDEGLKGCCHRRPNTDI